MFVSCRWRIYPRVLRDVSSVDMSTRVLGQRVSMPICVSATAMQKMSHPDGETATARGQTHHISSLLTVLSIITNHHMMELCVFYRTHTQISPEKTRLQLCSCSSTTKKQKYTSNSKKHSICQICINIKFGTKFLILIDFMDCKNLY